MASARVPGFLPSTCGFGFANAFLPQPLFRLPLAGLRVGDASRGLCGGMVFAARDYFERGSAPRPTATRPTTARRCSATSSVACSTASTCRGARCATTAGWRRGTPLS